MNTNGAFQELKGIVPPPTLRTCLDDMVDKFTGNPFADDDSDDEDGKSPKKNTKKSGDSDKWRAGSLRPRIWVVHALSARSNWLLFDQTPVQSAWRLASGVEVTNL